MNSLSTRVAIASDGVRMSDLKDEGATVSVPGDEGSEEERATLIDREEKANDSEVYSIRTCLKARSCKIALVVSIIVLLFVLAALILLLVAGLQGSPDFNCPVISLDNVFSDEFKVKTFTGKWTKDGQLLHLSLENGLVSIDPKSNSSTVLIDSDKLQSISDQYGMVTAFLPSPSLSADSVQLLLISNVTNVYRHSFLADYHLYSNGQVMEVTKPSELAEMWIQYATWSPTSNYIAYVIDYNIYLFNPSSPTDPPTAVTTDGSENGVIYGIPDWLYEEEILGTNNALWWSGDGENILYAAFNVSLVPLFSYPEYGPPENQYATIIDIHYPKPGSTNPSVDLYVANISSVSNINTVHLDPPEDIYFDHYFSYAGWADLSPLPYVVWLRRTQNFTVYCFYDNFSSNSSCYPVHRDQLETGWLEVLERPLVPGLPGYFLVTLKSQEYEGEMYTQLFAVAADNNSKFLTKPSTSVVTEIVGSINNDILYVATKEGPGTRHMYSYNDDDSTSICMTCSQHDWNIPPSPNPSLPNHCEYFSVSCDKQFNYCLLSCRGPCVPFSILVKYDRSVMHKRFFQPLTFVEINKDLREAVTGLCLPNTKTFQVPADSKTGAPSLNGIMLQPPNFYASKQYSVLVYVYGGPNSQVVDSTCILKRLSWLYYVSQLNIILAYVDGRGTGFRGDNFKFSVYNDLGHLETVDQIRGGRYLRDLPYTDGSHLAIMGASYGGYMSAMVGSSDGSDVFSTAIAQSPVTDWRYYDSAYTERYMNKPEDNPQGYHESSVLKRAENLKNVHFLLIHGTGDDNVHFQHTAQLVEALTQSDVQFRMQIYTDKTHSLTGGNTRRHLYQLIADFLREFLYN